MSETTKPSSHSGLTIIISIALAVAGFAGGGICFLQSRSLHARLGDTTKQLQQALSDLARTQTSLTAIEKQLDATKRELAQARSQIAQLEPLAAKAREMPVSVGFRDALLGSGRVLIMHNKTGKPLSLIVTAMDATSKKTKTFRIVVDGGLSRELGYAEGWAFASGDSVELACAGYDPIVKSVP
jgi:septal ring factor EnvC (AmiA/AmiB activator)